MKTNIYLSAALFAYSAVMQPVWAANTARITISATILASCTFVAPSFVKLNDIPASVLAGKSTGDKLTDYATQFELTAKCYGTDKYTYTFKPASVGGNCVGTDKGFLRFCLSAGNSELTMGTDSSPTYTGQAEVTTITVTPQVGITPATAGEVSGSMEVTIEPA